VEAISSYHTNMARKRELPAVTGPDWFLPEWMRTLRITQAALMRETGWSKATTNDIYHGKTNYYRQIVNEAARALKIEPWELLMPPDLAMQLRRLRDSALRIAAEEQIPWKGAPPESSGEVRRRTG